MTTLIKEERTMYETPEIKILMFESEDVLSASASNGGVQGGGNLPLPNDPNDFE